MKGLQVWVTTLLEYDKFGNATVLKSFSSIAKTSPVKKAGGTKPKSIAKVIPVATEDKKMW